MLKSRRSIRNFSIGVAVVILVGLLFLALEYHGFANNHWNW
nr:hypothetical protein [Alicyclobacillus tolerans]